MFRGIYPRFAGIGLASVYSSYIICFYYNVIIAWSLVYVVAGFYSPLPWSVHNEDWVWKCDPDKVTRAEQYFMIDTIRYYDDNCKPYEDGDPSQFSWKALLATFVVWALCFLGIFKGVHGSSYIVWFSVPVPLLFIIVMIINNSTLEGAGGGIKKYLQGEVNKFEGLSGEALKQAKVDDDLIQEKIWGDAAGQIFFSIGICMGIMTSYGSYNPIRKPIIMDNMIIALTNSAVSFIAGFAVWTVVGYLEAQKSLAQSKTSSIGLAFIAYPTACDMMPLPNLWALILGLTLFLLGIDSAFSMVEATSTVICDTPTGRGYPRMFVAFVLCFGGFILSIPFCTNWGFVLFDVIDHYLCAFLLILVGILQCAGVGWAFDAERTRALSEQHRKSMDFLAGAYWVVLLICGLVFVPLGMNLIGLLVWLFLTLIIAVVSKQISGMPFGLWYNEVAMCGVRKIAYSMTVLGRKEPAVTECWEVFYMVWWGTTIKFLIPGALWFILVGAFKNDFLNTYGGYAYYWQILGILIPMLGLVSFLLGLSVWVQPEEYDERQFDIDYLSTVPDDQDDEKLVPANKVDAEEPTKKDSNGAQTELVMVPAEQEAS